MKTTILRYQVLIRKQGKNYIADVPTLGISDFGKTLELAKKNVQGAIRCHIEGLAKTNSEFLHYINVIASLAKQSSTGSPRSLHSLAMTP